MHRQFVRQLDEAVADVFRVMLGRTCTPDQETAQLPHLRDNTLVTQVVDPARPLTLSASIHFTGAIQGSCDLHFPLETVAEITFDLTGIPPQELSPALCADTAGELCNMIAGSWKSAQSTHDTCALSCPTTSFGLSGNPSPATIMRSYRTAGQTFTLALIVSPSAGSSTPKLAIEILASPE